MQSLVRYPKPLLPNHRPPSLLSIKNMATVCDRWRQHDPCSRCRFQLYKRDSIGIYIHHTKTGLNVRQIPVMPQPKPKIRDPPITFPSIPFFVFDWHSDVGAPDPQATAPFLSLVISSLLPMLFTNLYSKMPSGTALPATKRRDGSKPFRKGRRRNPSTRLDSVRSERRRARANWREVTKYVKARCVGDDLILGIYK